MRHYPGRLQTEFDSEAQLRLADEISPDTCRLWNQSDTDPNRRVMDKDRFRRDLGNVENAYQQVLERFSPETAISGKTQADAQKLIGLHGVTQNKLNSTVISRLVAVVALTAPLSLPATGQTSNPSLGTEPIPSAKADFANVVVET